VTGMTPAIRSDLVDRLIELYCDWRAGCEHVRTAYKRFVDAPASDRAAAFAAYTAALDQEESASESYASQIRMIQSRAAGAAALASGADAVIG